MMKKKNAIYRSVEGERRIMASYDSVIDRWAVEKDILKIQTRFGETFALVSGPKAAPPLVLIHGSGGNSAMWAGDIPGYSKHFRVYALDIPGENGRSEQIRFPMAGEAPVLWMEDVLDGAGIGRTGMIGCSLGGYIALRFAAVNPGRVEKLALIAPGGIMPVRAGLILNLLLLPFLGRKGMEIIESKMTGGITLPGKVKEFNTLVHESFIPRTEPLKVLSDAELGRLKMPVFFTAGECDCFYNSGKAAARLRSLVRGCRCRIVPAAGHLLTETAVDILPFLLEEVPVTKAGLELIADSAAAGDVDTLMQILDDAETIRLCKMADYALSKVDSEEGVGRIEYYLFHGSQKQRNYACLHFTRRLEYGPVFKALKAGLVDELQAYSK
jgi:pimeloyl-ACP methyl ester carboxylesterase